MEIGSKTVRRNPVEHVGFKLKELKKKRLL
jgi:hypothetical protein